MGHAGPLSYHDESKKNVLELTRFGKIVSMIDTGAWMI